MSHLAPTVTKHTASGLLTLAGVVWLSVGGVVLVGAQQDSRAVRLALELPDNPSAGARLFAEKQCVRCHALGEGESRLGPDLGRLHFPGTVLDVAASFLNHTTVMRERMHDLKIAPPSLTSVEMADIIAFLTAYRYYLTQLGETGNPTDGAQVFAAKGCARCHGRQTDWEKRGPSLDRYRRRFSTIVLAQVMWNHGSEMAGEMRRAGITWPKFTGREMTDLLAYLQAGNETRSTERVYFEPGSPRRGRDLFTAKGCSKCHSIASSGARAGPDLGTRGRELLGSVASIAGLMWNHSQGMTAEFERRGIARVSFSGQEMADIIAYLYFVNYASVYGSPDRGTRFFADRCSVCHSIGRGPRVGPDLATAAGLDEPMAMVAAMWNHAPVMERELRWRGLMWPQFAPGELADLAAYVMANRRHEAAR